ncbi:uncharacterized protein [Anabrus simplex]|uniref:uncharacterized protein isoform X2 n=1 Tax=Anabrus simplex TaxID=316456 RepID=UPI0035A2B601
METNIMAKTSAIDNTGSSPKDDLPHCFVCDVGVTGRHYTLATCRTQATRIRLIEKLGQLVGERYMVVISEEDIICRGCANLINTLDRLESEMGSVRNVVLRFLEKKYALEDGELVNEKSTGVGLPPQITPAPSRNQGFSGTSSHENFMSRKRKAALSDLENEQENGSSINNKKAKKDSKSDTWMQCDKCKYTTHYNAFMIHHIRQHIKKKNPACDYCGEEVKSGGRCARQCGQKKPAEEPSTSNGNVPQEINRKPAEPPSTTQQEKEKPNDCDSEAETVEMIAAEINEFTGAHSSRSTESPDVVISAVQSGADHQSSLGSQLNHNTMLPTIPEDSDPNQIQTGDSVSTASQLNNTNEMTIEVAGMSRKPLDAPLKNNEEGSNPTAICVMDMSEENSTEEPTLLTVQKMEDDDSNAVYVQVVEMGKGVALDESGNMTKQVLTVAEDGTVEMVEVMWDEMVTPGGEPEQDIHF